MNRKPPFEPTVHQLPAKLGLSKQRTGDLFGSSNTHVAASKNISPELLLDVFEAPVVFHRILVDVTGSVTAALVLSQMLSVDQTLGKDAQGWFECSQDKWTEDTGLSRFEQSSARRILRELGILEEHRMGVPARLVYRIEHSTLWQLTEDASRERWTRRRAERPSSMVNPFGDGGSFAA